MRSINVIKVVSKYSGDPMYTDITDENGVRIEGVMSVQFKLTAKELYPKLTLEFIPGWGREIHFSSPCQVEVHITDEEVLYGEPPGGASYYTPVSMQKYEGD